jgi:hypothetical protein
MGHVGGLLGYGPYAGRRDEEFAAWKRSMASWRVPERRRQARRHGQPRRRLRFPRAAVPPSSEAIAEYLAALCRDLHRIVRPEPLHVREQLSGRQDGDRLRGAVERVQAHRRGRLADEKRALFAGTALGIPARVSSTDAFLLLAAIAWALGSCLYRMRVWRSGFWTQTFWQLAVSTPVVLAFALPQMSDEPVRWSIGLVAILAYNWVVTTALGYFLWAKVLSAMPAATAGQVLALTPVGGFLVSTAIFGGAVTLDVVAAVALIVAGIILTLRGPRAA